LLTDAFHGNNRDEVAGATAERGVLCPTPQKGICQSEASTRGNIVSTHCFLDVLDLTSLRSSVGYGVMAHDGMVTTLPKTRPGAIRPSQHNRLLYLILAILSLPKTVAFGKDSDVGSCLLLPHITASLGLGRVGTRGGMIQTRNAKMIACHWHVRILLYQGTHISRDDDSAHKVYLTRLSDFRVLFDVSSWDSQIISQIWRHQPRTQ